MDTTRPEKGSHLLRQGRFSQPGGIYFLTTSSYDKQPFFQDEQNVQVVFGSLDWLQEGGYIDLHCCIVMPEHVHLVLQLIGSRDLAGVMLSFKGFTGHAIKRRMGLETPVWQEQYYDHLIPEGREPCGDSEVLLVQPGEAGTGR